MSPPTKPLRRSDSTRNGGVGKWKELLFHGETVLWTDGMPCPSTLIVHVGDRQRALPLIMQRYKMLRKFNGFFFFFVF